MMARDFSYINGIYSNGLVYTMFNFQTYKTDTTTLFSEQIEASSLVLFKEELS